jgi:hypothetical protein
MIIGMRDFMWIVIKILPNIKKLKGYLCKLIVKYGGKLF